MTVQEFEDRIIYFDDLYQFCTEHDMGLQYELVSLDDFDREVEECINDILRNERWTSVYQFLNNLDDGFEWYIKSDGTFVPLDEYDLPQYKSQILDEAIGLGILEADVLDEPEDDPEDELEDASEECDQNDMISEESLIAFLNDARSVEKEKHDGLI